VPLAAATIGAALAACHFAVKPLHAVRTLYRFTDEFSSAVVTLAAIPVRSQQPLDIVLLNVSDFHVAFFGPATLRVVRPDLVIRSWRILPMVKDTYLLSRTESNGFELAQSGTRTDLTFLALFFRTSGKPLHEGYRLNVEGFLAEVVEMAAGRPARLRFAFPESLEDPQLALLVFRNGRLERVVPPAVGGRLEIPAR
jgi:hypothetical protein